MEKVEIDKDKPLQPGDIIELHFKTIGMVWITAAQIALIEWQLEGRKDFTILSYSLPANNNVIFTVRIDKTNPVIVTAAVIGGLIIGAGVIGWLTLDKVYQIMETPTGQIFVGGIGSIALAIAITTILALLPKGGK